MWLRLNKKKKGEKKKVCHTHPDRSTVNRPAKHRLWKIYVD